MIHDDPFFDPDPFDLPDDYPGFGMFKKDAGEIDISDFYVNHEDINTSNREEEIKPPQMDMMSMNLLDNLNVESSGHTKMKVDDICNFQYSKFNFPAGANVHQVFPPVERRMEMDRDRNDHPSPNNSTGIVSTVNSMTTSNWSGSDEEKDGKKKGKKGKKRRKRRRKRKEEEIQADEKRMEELKKIKNRSSDEKEELRKLRNRFSAAKSREKKRREMQDKEGMISELKDDNKRLERKVEKLQKKIRGYEKYFMKEIGQLPPDSFFTDREMDLEYEHRHPRRKRRKTNKSNGAKKRGGLVLGVLILGMIFLVGMGRNNLFNSGRRNAGIAVGREILQYAKMEDHINATPIHSNNEGVPGFAQDEVLRAKNLGPYYGESESFDPSGMNCEEIIVPEKMLDNHFNMHHNSEKIINKTTIDIIENDENEDYTLIKEEPDVEESDKSKALVSFMNTNDAELAYYYSPDLIDVDLMLFCPHIYEVVSSNKFRSFDGTLVNGDELIHLSYPVAKKNTSSGETVYEIESIKVHAGDITFQEGYISMKKIEIDG